MFFKYRGYFLFYGGYDFRYSDFMYGGVLMFGFLMLGYYYGYLGMYRENLMFREDNVEFLG